MKKIIAAILVLLMLCPLAVGAADNYGAELGTELIFSNWSYSASSQWGTANGIDKVFDHDTATYWHTNVTFAEGKAVSADKERTISVDFGKVIDVSGWLYTPRNDNALGTVLAYNVYSSTDGKSFEQIYSSSFKYGTVASENKPQGGSWGNTKMRCIKIEVTSAVSGDFATAAEISFYKDGKVIEPPKAPAAGAVIGREAMDGTPLYEKKGWTATVNSDGHGKVSNIFDNNIATYWHTSITASGGTVTGHDEPPFHLVITLPKDYTTSGIILTPRTDNQAGIINKADIYVSASEEGEDWFLLKEGVTFTSNYIPQELAFTANITVRRIWVEVLAGQGGYGSLAEFDLMMAKDDFETVSYKDYIEHEKTHSLYEISTERMTVDCAEESWGANIPANIFDGSSKSFWQTNEVKSDWPVTLSVDLNNVYKIKEIRYLPRQSADCHGAWLSLSVYGGTEKENLKPIKENISFPKNINLKSIILDKEAEVRYVELRIEEAYASRVSCAELTFLQSYAAKEADEEKNRERYTLKIGSNIIETNKGGEISEKELDVGPFIVNGSTMIPLRGLLEEMGAQVTWNGKNETIDIDNGQNRIKLQIWSKLVYVYGTTYGDLRYTLLNPPMIKDQRTFVPIRFVSEQLGYNVTWDGEAQAVTIER